jgi:tRNA(fMet)-specific endonuclease VapC
MICLDTNAVIAAMKGEPAPLMDRFRRALTQDELALSAIVLFELHYGVANSARPVENAERLAIFLQAPMTILSFEPEDSEEAGAIRAELKRAGTPIGPYDALIAAQARRREALLVTANAGEFARVPGLRTQDWAAA